MLKTLHVTVDYPDDIESMEGWYSRRHIAGSMLRFKELGISRVYWISYHDSMLRDRLADDPAAHSLTRSVIDEAHVQGIECYGLFKPFEMGLCIPIPPAIILPKDLPAVTSRTGVHPLTEQFVTDHPEMRMRSRHRGSAGSLPSMIKLVKEGPEATLLGAGDLQICVSATNGNFHPYDGDFEFTDSIEKRHGADCRVLTFAHLKLPEDTAYLLVRCVAPTGQPDFVNTHGRLMEVYDHHGRLMRASHDEGPIFSSIDTGLSSLVRGLRMLGLWKSGNPSEHLPRIPKDYGRTPLSTGYMFEGDTHKSPGRRALNGDGSISPFDGVIVLTLLEKEYLWGALHPCYPEVREHWLSRIRDAVELGVDGVDIRICNHSSWAANGDDFGFNEPAVAEFQDRYHKNVMTDEFDMEHWKTLQHEYWMTFLREARSLVSSHGLPLQLHVPSYLAAKVGVPLNNVPSSFGWDWKRWITEPDLCDSIHLKWPHLDPDFSGEVAEFAKRNGKQVTFSLRLQYRKMDGTQNERLRKLLRWAEENESIDAIVLYEKDCFTSRDPASDEIVTLSAVKDLLR